MKKLIIGTAAAMGAFAGLAVWNYRRIFPKPRAMSPEANEVEVKKLPVVSGGHTLCGELLLPKGRSGRLPTVIVSHGLGSNGKNARNLVGMSLAMSGFAVYCFDFWGGSLNSKSGGRMWEMTVFTERDDLNAVIDRIKTLDTTDADKLFLLGESQGGFVTAITAAERPKDIRAVIEYYPAFCIPEDARARHGSAESIPEVESLGGNRLGRSYSEQVFDYDVYSVIPAYTGPVLIIHGDADRVVDISYGRRAAEAYEDAELVCLPGEIHGFTGKGKIKAAKLTYDFLRQVLEEE